ncbi:MAG: hypothetical protein II604_03405, partial [Bacteroidales bacterium]|nr:hypothetical protein [Bacteroidales bacterium]
MNYTILDPDEQGFAKVEKFSKEKTERLAGLYSEILGILGIFGRFQDCANIRNFSGRDSVSCCRFGHSGIDDFELAIVN